MIKLAETDDEINGCFAVMSQLRTNLWSGTFLEQVKRQMDDNFKLAFLAENGEVKAVAGFRIGEMLHRGRYLYVDDLATDEEERSKGYGDALFDWLVEYAKAENCIQFHLDSGVQRFDAHRFYFRKRMKITSYHFALDL